MSDQVIIEHQQHHALVTLNRPKARNAYSTEMIDVLIETLDQLELNDQVRAVILTGAGRAFSAGGDLKLMRDKGGMFAGGPVELRTRYMQDIQRVPRRLARFSKPIIAAVNGPAIGAGFDLSLMCDLRIASSEAKFGSTFIKVGLIPGDGGAYYLARAIGLARALELCLTGRVIDAQEAQRIGVVSDVVNPEMLISKARALAEEIAANAPLAVQLTKAAAYQSLTLTPDAALQLAASFQGVAQNTADHLEGVNAMLEKRTPVFKGH
jgi:enoyl-CoA hydratase/carnithine racemase